MGYYISMKLKLVEKKDEAKGTTSFFLEPERPVSFLPGQYIYLTIPTLIFPDSKGRTRHFTISSSPTEGEILRVTTRMREESGFKKSLDELPIGAQIDGEGPNGTFVFDEGEKLKNVFVAGGIGITPFRSMIKYIVDKNLTTPIYLIYSNSDNDFVFKKEFDEIVSSHPNIKVQYVPTSTEGHLDELKISKFITNQKFDMSQPGRAIENWKLKISSLTWWLCGPPPMVDTMENVLGKMGITSNHIRSEKFTGY